MPAPSMLAVWPAHSGVRYRPTNNTQSNHSNSKSAVKQRSYEPAYCYLCTYQLICWRPLLVNWPRSPWPRPSETAPPPPPPSYHKALIITLPTVAQISGKFLATPPVQTSPSVSVVGERTSWLREKVGEVETMKTRKESRREEEGREKESGKKEKI